MFSPTQTVMSCHIFGIRVDIDRSLVMLVLLIGFLSGGGQNPVWAVSIVAMLVGSIFLHELGHAWGCRVQGVPVRRVVLYGGGGLCEQARSATRHQSELIVAMGPLVNLAIWALAGLGQWAIYAFVFNRIEGVTPAQMTQAAADNAWIYEAGFYLDVLGRINLALFLLNLIPVHPLDGGKLSELALMRVLPPRSASRISGWIGTIAAVLWWPALILLYVSSGWILFFAPSIRDHWRKAKGKQA